MDLPKESVSPHHRIETLETPPTVLVVSNEGFITSYLAEKILELPLNLSVVVDHETSELKDLVQDKRFTLKITKDPGDVFPDELPSVEYIFQILRVENSEAITNQIQSQTENLVKRCMEVQAKFQLVMLLSQADSNTPRLSEITRGISLNGDHLNARVTKIINAYGPKMDLAINGTLERFFTEVATGALQVEGEGLNVLFPVFATDAATALVKAMFTDGTKGETLLVAGEKEITALNLAYKLRELILHETGELIEIKFVDQEKGAISESDIISRSQIKEERARSQRIIGWKPQISLEEGLLRSLTAFNLRPKKLADEREKTQGSISAEKKKEKKEPLTRDKSYRDKPGDLLGKAKRRATAWMAGVAIGMIVLVPMIFAGTVVVGGLALNQAGHEMKQAQLNTVASNARFARQQFDTAQAELHLLFALLPNWAKHSSLFQRVDDDLRIGSHLAQALQHASVAATDALQIKDFVLGKSDGEVIKYTQELDREIQMVYTNLGLAEAMMDSHLKGSDSKGILQLADKKERGLRDLIHAQRLRLAKALKLVGLVDKLIAQNDKKTYLVLLQNSAELRPTGGFIGSYAIVTFQDAKLTTLSVEDVYVADGQLKGHVEPPLEIKKYLGEGGWYLRDANWDPDFPTAARQIEWFYEKETGNKVDGTIAVNLYVIEEALRALGPIELTDYKEKVGPDNLFKTAEYYSEINTFPGSTQKKDFLASLTDAMFVTLEESKTNELLKLTLGLYNALENDQLLLAFHDPKIQEAIHDLGWDGSLKDPDCVSEYPQGSCIENFLAIREANLGVNKANYYVKRAIEVDQKIQNDAIQTRLNIRYQNQSPTDAWPAGQYKNYMRIYLNPESKVLGVKIDGAETPAKDLQIRAEHGKISVGFLVAVPVQKERTVEVSIQSEGLQFKDGVAGVLLWMQKQPGTQDDPLTIRVTFDPSLRIKKTNQPLITEGGSATLTQNFIRDLNLFVEFEKVQ